MTVVLDTNVLLACYSPRSRLYPIWQAYRQQAFTLCVTTDILSEYAEILTRHANPAICSLILDIVVQSPNTRFVTKHFFWQLIENDPDDRNAGPQQFVDCGLMANADFIVTEDGHFNILAKNPFPAIGILKADAFVALLNSAIA